MNAKRITREGYGGFVVVRMTEREADNLAGVGSSVRGLEFESALRKLRAAILNVNGDTTNATEETTE